MNKALHVFVYLFLILTGVAFYFTYQMHLNKEEMSDRNKLLREAIIDATKHIENYQSKGSKDAIAAECPDLDDYKVDSSETGYEWSSKYIDPDSGEAKHTKIDIDKSKKNVLEEIADAWQYYLEKNDHDTVNWGPLQREKLRNIYILDAEGKPETDGTTKKTIGSEADTLLKDFRDLIKTQRDQLVTTRKAFPALRGVIRNLVKTINELKPQLRDANAKIKEHEGTIANLNDQKSKLQNEIEDHKTTIDSQKAEIFSLKDEVAKSRQETEAAKEELSKEKEMVANLKKMIQDLRKSLVSTASGSGSSELGGAVTSVPSGDKGKIIEVNNDAVFAIIEVTPEAMKELKGNDLMRPLPMLEFAVKRPGFNGPAGEIVGRIRLRQEVTGKKWIVCDILANWSQDSSGLKIDDVIFAD